MCIRDSMKSAVEEARKALDRDVIDIFHLHAARVEDVYKRQGSGGANDLASLCWRTLMISPHDPRRFVEKVDFVTTPGYLSGKGAREAAGLPPGTGPYKVITNLCVMGFDEETSQMKVESTHPGITRDDIIKNTGFELLWDHDVKESLAPTGEELRILREEVDPMKYIIGRQAS